MDIAEVVTTSRDGTALLYGAIVLLFLTWIIFMMRVSVRIWRTTWGMDDYLMSIGIILFSVTASLCIVCSFYGSGQHSGDLPPLIMAKGIKLFYIAEFFYAVSAMFIKISVAITLMRIAAARRPFEWALWGVIAATIIAALVFCVGVAHICHPIDTLWGESDGICNLQLNTDVSLFFSAIEIMTDFSLSIMPAVLLWNVQMERKVKASVAIMLALASFASCATIVRLKYLTLYSDPGEFIYATGKVGFWSITEEGIGIIAGSLHALHPLLSLRVRSTTTSNTPAVPSNLYPSERSRRQFKVRLRGIMMDTLTDNDEIDYSDGDSQRKITEETGYVANSAHVGSRAEGR